MQDEESLGVFIDKGISLDFAVWTGCILAHKALSDRTYRLGMKIKLQTSAPLYDLVQQKLPNLQRLRFVPEILHIIPIVSLFSLIFVYCNSASVLALRKFLRKHGLLMLLRGICFSTTLLPDSSQMCTTSSHIGSCFDLIFSGHSTAVILSTKVMTEFFNIDYLLSLLFDFNTVITCILIVLCRNHYTIDVIVSVLATNYVYSF